MLTDKQLGELKTIYEDDFELFDFKLIRRVWLGGPQWWSSESRFWLKFSKTFPIEFKFS